MKLALRYTFFALIATAVNIASQDIVIRLYAGAFAITLSVLAGTFTGLVVKYLLDKKYIFRDLDTGVRSHSRKFFLYSLMGVATTLIFWGFEGAFHLIFQTREMRYLGGVIGLAIGYYVKYRLDRRFVFTGKE